MKSSHFSACTPQLAFFAAVVAFVLSATRSVNANAYTYSCIWKSQASPNAAISFSSTNGTNTYTGALFYKGRRLMPIYEGSTLGYSTNWWNNVLSDDLRTHNIVSFVGNKPALSTREKSGEITKLLIVGLGSRVWYGSDFSWRDDEELLMAAEGFWIPGPGCRHYR
jgi:hypothetical protein